jgi:solute carrier family 25 protein 39/40
VCPISTHTRLCAASRLAYPAFEIYHPPFAPAPCPPLHIPSLRNSSVYGTAAYSAQSVSTDFMTPYATFGGPRVFEVYGRALERHCEWNDDALSVTRSLPMPSSVIGVPSSTAYMLTYDYLLRQVLPAIIPYPSVIPLAAGITARSIVSSVVSPLELIRTNLQSTPRLPDTPHTLRSVLNSLEALVRANGVRHLWRGLGPTLWRDVPFSGFYWASYESMKHRLEQRGRSGPSLAFVCGATSGTAAALLTSPLDVLKTRRQAFVMSTTPGQQTRALPLLRQIVRTEGVSALFAGLGPRIAKIAPACGIMIACYEVCVSCLFLLRRTHLFFARALDRH